MKKKILIIDGKESIRKGVAVDFEEEYNITYLDNPLLGVAWLEEGNVPDLILSDIRMPVMRGDEFLHFVKNSEFFKTIPFVVLSSESSNNQRVRLLESGADDYIAKPCNPAELKFRLRKILE